MSLSDKILGPSADAVGRALAGALPSPASPAPSPMTNETAAAHVPAGAALVQREYALAEYEHRLRLARQEMEAREMASERERAGRAVTLFKYTLGGALLGLVVGAGIGWAARGRRAG